MGLGDEAEGAEVAQEDPSQDDVAQLPAGGLHHGGVPEPDADTTRPVQFQVGIKITNDCDSLT